MWWMGIGKEYNTMWYISEERSISSDKNKSIFDKNNINQQEKRIYWEFVINWHLSIQDEENITKKQKYWINLACRKK